MKAFDRNVSERVKEGIRMLHLVLGRAGSGKTAYAIEKAASCGTKAVLLVPEQFTFEAEKHLLSRAGPRAGLSIEVLSFKRLAHRVFSLYGGVARRYIGECGKYIVMRMALRQVADTLHVYEGQAAGPAFVKAMVDTVEEYRTYGATPEVLGKISDKVGGGLLHDKLLDVRLVYETYQALLGENRYDAADELEVLARTLEGHRFFENKTVVADSFKGFTPQERMVLARIMAQARDVYITLCADELNGAGLGLFAPVQKTAQQLITVANRVGVPVAAPMCLPAPRRFRTPALRFLEEKIFRASGAAYEGDAPEIRLVTAENFYEEAQFAAQTIAALVREQGCRFRDIVVIAGEPELYRGILDPVFEKYDIPLFLDARRAVDTHPLMVYVLSLFEIVLEDFRPGQVPRCLKTGLTDLSVEEISALENYTLQWNIKGFDVWNAPFTGNPAGFGQAMTPADEKALAALNGIRARLMKRLAVFRRQLQGAQKSGEFCRYVYEFLKSDGIEEKLPRLCEAFKAAGELELADEYLRMWEALVGVLDQLALTIGDFSVEPRDFYELLKLGITASDIGHIPASLDEVTFGDAERIRTGEAQYVFVLGLAEGIFPRSESSGGLFTRAERRRLGLAGLELSPAGREQAEEERFFAYKAFTCASRACGCAARAAMRPGPSCGLRCFSVRRKSSFPMRRRRMFPLKTRWTPCRTRRPLLKRSRWVTGAAMRSTPRCGPALKAGRVMGAGSRHLKKQPGGDRLPLRIRLPPRVFTAATFLFHQAGLSCTESAALPTFAATVFLRAPGGKRSLPRPKLARSSTLCWSVC